MTDSVSKQKDVLPLLRVAVLGAGGRMGQAILTELQAQDGVSITGAVVRSAPKASDAAYPVTEQLAEVLKTSDVLIDFSNPGASLAAAAALDNSACPAWIVGTTGIQTSEQKTIEALAQSKTIVQSDNFSLGVNVLLALVRQAATILPGDWDAEISERHHRDKADAPSGTALSLGRQIAAARDQVFREVAILSREGRESARRPGDIGFSAIRGGGAIGDHQVDFLSAREMLTLGHRAFERSIYAEGAVLAARWAATREPGLYSMMDVLDVGQI